MYSFYVISFILLSYLGIHLFCINYKFLFKILDFIPLYGYALFYVFIC